MSFVVRPATVDDAAAVAQLEREARQALVDARGGAALLAEQPAVADWAALIAAPDRRVWVATIDDVVLGYLELATPTPGGAGVVRQVYVHPEAREVGFGDEMLAAAIDAIRQLGGVDRRVVRPARRSRHEEPVRTGGGDRPQDHRLEADQ